MAILTPAQLLEHVETTLGTDALQRLLDDAEAAITGRLGVVGDVQEYLRASGDLLVLSRRADEVGDVIEGLTTLEGDDYELRADGQTLRRLTTGTNPGSCWRGRIDITYTPVADMAERVRAQIALVELELNYAPGVKRERIGDWEEEQAASAEGLSYDQMRESILASLGERFVMQ